MSWILLGYGVSVAIGNVWGGKLADKHGAVSALKFIFAALVLLLLVFQLTASVHYAALATVLVMGVFAGAVVAVLSTCFCWTGFDSTGVFATACGFDCGFASITVCLRSAGRGVAAV